MIVEVAKRTIFDSMERENFEICREMLDDMITDMENNEIHTLTFDRGGSVTVSELKAAIVIIEQLAVGGDADAI